jgi:hypothetical protein
MSQANMSNTDSGDAITQSSGHFAPRLYNQSAADPVTGFYHQTAAAGMRLYISYQRAPNPTVAPALTGEDREQTFLGRFDLPAGDSFSDADAAAIGFELAQRRSGLPISEVDLGSDL